MLARPAGSSDPELVVFDAAAGWFHDLLVREVASSHTRHAGARQAHSERRGLLIAPSVML